MFYLLPLMPAVIFVYAGSLCCRFCRRRHASPLMIAAFDAATDASRC